MAPRRGKRSTSSNRNRELQPSEARITQEILARGREIDLGIQNEIAKVVFGEEIKPLVDVLITALFAGEHVLTRAPIGLAKTLTCSALARTISGEFHKLQFLPDMLPSEIAGFEFYDQKTGELKVKHGPLYGANVVLADEINRTTPKAQAALLGPMESRYVVVGSKVFAMEPLFIVLATRNPIEHEGVYDLPEAQLDRFAFQPIVRQMSEETLMLMLGDPDYWKRAEDRLEKVKVVATPAEILAVHDAIFANAHVEERLERYIARLVVATREHKAVKKYGEASPRGARFLQMAATISAFRQGRVRPDELIYVAQEDVERYAVDVLAHRIFLKMAYRDESGKDVSPADVVQEVLERVHFD
jgi:MoxR-like ATPase